MNEEEKEAIEYIKELIKPPLREEWDFAYKLDKTTAKQFKTLLSYIDRLQKELQYEKNEKMNLAGMLDEKDEEIKSLEIDLEIGNNICANLHKENEKLEAIKEYINSPEFLDWHLGFKLIDELECRKDRINKLLGETKDEE